MAADTDLTAYVKLRHSYVYQRKSALLHSVSKGVIPSTGDLCVWPELIFKTMTVTCFCYLSGVYLRSTANSAV